MNFALDTIVAHPSARFAALAIVALRDAYAPHAEAFTHRKASKLVHTLDRPPGRVCGARKTRV